MNRSALGFALVLSTVIPLAAAEPLVEKAWKVGNDDRKALVYAPPKPSNPAPLVFVFHGHGGTMANAARSFHIHTVWPEAVVVYPQGLNTPGQLTDPKGEKPGWQAAKGNQDDRDLKFFDAMLAGLKKDHAIDEKRVYSTGHSNGGGFTYLLWANRYEVFAAVAPSAAAARYARELKPLPAMHLGGEKDPLVKFDLMQKPTMEAVKRVNGCDAEGKEWAKAGDLVGTQFPSKGGTPFVAAVSATGTHTFPKEGPELIVKFFKEHAKK
jgi:polyhydroxybutyrate depolymerase